ncbi:class I SAM-dependent methyltransferase [Methyloligella solikamskensis]|uniref:Class I SAM-dependent methyltransferase n=1 Tax=Methyloligella solikamskensis TaxID=1177756 RepID=A0ABW3J962_9HYPH
MEEIVARFSDPEAVAGYSDGPVRYVPGLADLHRMAGVLLAERAPDNGRILVLGAGGGMELKALAEAHPGWTFVGVDPARPMLDLAERKLGPSAERVEFVHGYIDDAPEGPFDGAVCLLTLHFLDAPERTRTAGEIRRRLKPGAPFVAAHVSCPQGEDEQDIWLSRYAAFAVAAGEEPERADKWRSVTAANRNLMFSPEKNAAILEAAGFSDVALFYAAFTWRGWVAYA